MKNIYPLTLLVLLLMAQVHPSIAALNCTNTVSNFPYSENFTSPSATWGNTTSDDHNWTRHTGSTSSGSTGPSSAKNGSYYYYIESSTRDKGYPSKTAILKGPCFNLSGKSSAQITFYYHMHGSTMGALQLQASTNGSSWSTLWSKSGDQGDSWKQAIVSLNNYAGQTVQLRFYGTTGSSFRSDMAVDYIQVAASGSSGSLNGGSISPSAKTITSGQSPGTLANSSSASGGSGNLHYQWLKSTNNGSSWSNIIGASATYYTPPVLTQTTWYKRRAARGNSTAYSNISKITVTTDGGSGGTADNLGNHTATQNIKLNGNWLSGDGGNEGIYINNYGRVGIKTSNMGNYELAVNGEIIAKEVVVETGWADFVFKPGYQLKTLAQVEQFIKNNGHLPGIPSENEVKENGIGMGQANTLLLQKIEELTLYIIQQQKEIEQLKQQLKSK